MTLSDDGGKPFERVSNAFRKAAEWLHAKKAFTPDMLSEPEPAELIKATHGVLASELSAIGLKIPAEITQTLDDNIFLFSGFKTYHEMNDASRLLKDDDGGFKPFGSFLQDIQSIDSQYNRNYLYAEYNFAKASTQMAVKWHDIEKDGDDYNLQYRTASDGLVRPEHAALEGVTLPPSDKFWNEYYPPNGWNCRCNAVQVLKDKYAASDSDQACAAGERATTQIGRNGANKAEMFRFNPGKAGKIFPPKHPYYKAPEEVKKVVEKVASNVQTVNIQDEFRKWVKETLPEAKVGKFVAHRFEVRFGDLNGIINKNSYNEIANKGKYDDDYTLRLSLAKKLHLYVGEFKYLPEQDEAGRDHPDSVFKLFKGSIDGHDVLIKVKCNKDENVLWAMQLL